MEEDSPETTKMDNEGKQDASVGDYRPEPQSLRVKTFTQRFFAMPKPAPHALRTFIKYFYTPVLMLSVPIIFFCGFQVGNFDRREIDLF